MLNGKLIRETRLEKGLSAGDLSYLINVHLGMSISKSYLEELERGSKVNPAFNKVAAIAYILDIDMNRLVLESDLFQQVG